MSRVTVTNNVAGTYLIPSPISKKIAQNVTTVYDGIMASDLEKAHAFHQAISDGSITVVVSDDPNVPNSLEISPLSELADRGANLRTEEFTDPATADTNAIKTTFASSASIQTLTGTALNGVIGQLEMIPPRNPSITTDANGDIDAVTTVWTGTVRNETGELVHQSMTLLCNAGAATEFGLKAFSFVSSVVIPAMTGVGGAIELGFGAGIGLKAQVKSRAGLIKPLRQIAAGTVVTTGTFLNPTSGVVTVYTPAAPPDAGKDYAVTYEVG